MYMADVADTGEMAAVESVDGVSIPRKSRQGWHKKGGITGSTFKLVGIITMFIDHTAAVILVRELLGGSVRHSPDDFVILFWVYQVMRWIGRIGFPVFCFLLVEGARKTRSMGKYAFRLGVFALLSEIPFNLALTSQMIEFRYQNVYFTLFLGLMALWGFKVLENWKLSLPAGILACVTGVVSIGTYVYFRMAGDGILVPVAVCLVVAVDLYLVGMRRGFFRAAIAGADLIVLSLAMFLADLMQTDYAGMGVLTIAAMYLCRRRKMLAMLAGCLVLTFTVNGSEIFALLALIPAALYNGERGLRMKYVFYLFYPVHLLVLYGIAVLMGLGGIPAV